MGYSRTAQREDQIRKIVAQMLERRVKDHRLGYVTITDVKLTGDGREATIFYTDMGASVNAERDDVNPKRVNSQAALEAAKGMLRTAIGQHLKLKFTPTLSFVRDASEQTAREMEDLLARVQASDAKLAQNRGTAFAGEADPYRSSLTDEDNAASE